jgi:hypothetical protein
MGGQSDGIKPSDDRRGGRENADFEQNLSRGRKPEPGQNPDPDEIELGIHHS